MCTGAEEVAVTLHLATRPRAVLALSFDGAVTFPARVLLSVFLDSHITQARNRFYTDIISNVHCCLTLAWVEKSSYNAVDEAVSRFLPVT